MLTKIRNGWWLDITDIEHFVIENETLEGSYFLKDSFIEFGCCPDDAKLLEQKIIEYFGRNTLQ